RYVLSVGGPVSGLLGRQLDGVWHTSIVVYGREYYFGSSGVQDSDPSGTILGNPLKTVDLGNTFIPKQTFLDYITELNESTFRGSTYDLFSHNCNNFSNELAQFLVGQEIPKYILDLPQEVLSTPIGALLQPLIAQIAASGHNIPNFHLTTGPGSSANVRAREDSPDLVKLNSDIEEARLEALRLAEKRNRISEKIAKRERKEQRKKRRESFPAEQDPDAGGGDSRRRSLMADTEVNGGGRAETESPARETRKDGNSMVSVLEEQEKREREERRQLEEEKRMRDPPIVFRESCDLRVEFDKLVGLIDGKMNADEQQSLEELHLYMLEDEGSWALGDGFLNFIGRLLHDKTLPCEVRVHTLHVLALAALKDDSILLLHQDRREHVLMNYAFDVDRLSLEEQQALALFVCNLFENLSSSEWLLYISEWQYCNNNISNIRVTTKVAVNSLLSEDPLLRDRGSAIIHNLACKEKMLQNASLRRLLPRGSKSKVFDDVAVELAMALLQFFNSNPAEEQLFRTMKALARFCQVAPSDVPQLVQMIGPEPAKFKGTSKRVDEQIQAVQSKMR
ncbi:uncharacterized protein LOC117646237, partial [Thrips palmi]|uniref:Uncharacterized protein LOC117646237 n=1 Tax=Thrips palmi TaxID=161013 RepID=A0A6P8Z036_THRPL